MSIVLELSNAVISNVIKRLFQYRHWFYNIVVTVVILISAVANFSIRFSPRLTKKVYK